MNIFFRELKFYRKSLIFWCIGMVALISSGMAKFAAYSDTGQSINEMISKFPQSVQTIFGLTGFDLSKSSGYVGVLFMYMALMATIHAVLLGVNILSKEESDKTYEFLFTKPISRFKVVTSKITAGVLNLVLLNLVTFISSIYFVYYFTKESSTTNYTFVLMCGMMILQLIFFFIGTMVAALSKKSKTAPSIATSVLLFTFLLTYIINIDSNLNFLKYLSPFKYFDAKDILINNQLDIIFIIISLVIILASIITTYRAYNNKDLK